MKKLGRGEAMCIFLRLAYTGSHSPVQSTLLLLVSYVQTCCEVVNVLKTSVGVSQLPVGMNGDVQASRTTVSCSSSAALGSPFSGGPTINHNSWRRNSFFFFFFFKSDLNCFGEKKAHMKEAISLVFWARISLKPRTGRPCHHL